MGNGSDIADKLILGTTKWLKFLNVKKHSEIGEFAVIVAEIER